MVASSALLLLSLPLALAQYGGSGADSSSPTSTASTSTTTASSSASLQTITVGDNGLSFNPSTLTAAVGSQVEFIFFPPTHSVVQASFAKPCQPINDTGFFSGAFTTSSGSNANSFTITVNDTTPIWFFCGFPGHCETGMVGVINEPSDNSKTLAEFKAAAAKVSSTTAPTFKAQGGIVGPVKAASASSGSSSSSSTSSAATPSATQNASPGELKGSMFWAGFLATGLSAWGIAGLMA